MAGSEIRGVAVPTGTCVAAKAGPGEVLASSTVKDLVAGSGLEFEDRGLARAERRALASASSFDDYFLTVPDPQKAELERVRQLVRRFVPEAEEAMSYWMPAFTYRKRPLLGFRVSKNHLSVFLFTDTRGHSRHRVKGRFAENS